MAHGDTSGGRQSAGAARLVLGRPSGGQTGTVRRIAVKVDGSTVARLRPGASRTVEVSPGRHRVVARMDWLSSHPLDVDVAESRDVTLRVSLPFPLGMVGLFRPRGVIALSLVDPDD